MRTCFVTVLALGLLAAAAAREGDAAADDGERIQGRWQVATAGENGRQLQVTRADVLTFTADTITQAIDGRSEAVGYRLDPAATPKAIDMGLPVGGRRGFLIRAVYRLEGDTLTLCYHRDGGPRPTAFVAGPGTRQGVMVLRREGRR
jgi:uncharacterized protein (TIGR03067 family)